ncbi:MAG: cupin [Flavobacteriaceae bacterium]|mgnify:CR=1 FL=1|nr:cupin [Flavobacteriaceae bacterium]|tara:strand:- start:10882 stop:11193 length:312 start_codon:yes stop_codon:yes gene_type:complete
MNIKELSSNEIMPGFHGRIIHGSDFTWVYWEIDKGASLPQHNHVNEQLMYVIEGKFEFTFEGKINICTKGSTFFIPSNVPHSGRAITKCKIIDVFSPKRDDIG